MFKGLSVTERVVVIAILAAGVASLAIGTYADATGFWDEKAFLTNIVSGFSGACFGIPFAFLVLRQMADNRIERVQKKALGSLSRQAASAFRQSLEEYSFILGVPTEQSLKIALTNQRRDMTLKDNCATSQAQANLQVSTDELERKLSGLPDRVQFEEQWARMEEAWRFIRDVVKVRYYEGGITWLAPQDEMIVNRVLGRNTHAFSNFERLIDRTTMFQNNGLDVGGHFDAVDDGLAECLDMEKFRDAAHRVLQVLEYNWWLR